MRVELLETPQNLEINRNTHTHSPLKGHGRGHHLPLFQCGPIDPYTQEKTETQRAKTEGKARCELRQPRARAVQNEDSVGPFGPKPPKQTHASIQPACSALLSPPPQEKTKTNPRSSLDPPLSSSLPPCDCEAATAPPLAGNASTATIHRRNGSGRASPDDEPAVAPLRDRGIKRRSPPRSPP
jgi:hypothetical protein